MAAIHANPLVLEEHLAVEATIDASRADNATRPNNSRNSRNESYSYTGWNSMKTLTNKDLVEKKSNPTNYLFYFHPEYKQKLTLFSLHLPFLSGALFAKNTHSVEIISIDLGLTVLKEVDFQTQKQAVRVPLGSAEKSLLAMPPHQSNESFRKVYEVVLILDDRDTFGPRSRRKVVDNIRSQFNIPVEIKHLLVGDALWIARHKELDTEYVLDFIVERKNVDDLLGSIKDNRYKDQKLRLKKCGLRKLIYLVEGDVNTVDGSESVKTACFTTEVLEGFDVQRTTGYADTEKKYGHFTRSIIGYYSRNFSAGADSSRVCLTYDEFVKRCSNLEKVTMSDIFALQLMQVPQVTEEAALAVTSLYPTLPSLAKAYTMLDGDRHAQEEMLKNKSDMVNAGASKNIFKLIGVEG
ncbi:crossover junction endonuclease MUS81-like [Triticum dicoccoides]|uniref:crossover junction endonuclease MUS81-like n=1 Tax=Triticum dicoccoides TaxID=85692 RepID=UPI0018905EE9|nr:crossover junction endonuclease MUS81-like [Triticum dicoccoides]